MSFFDSAGRFVKEFFTDDSGTLAVNGKFFKHGSSSRVRENVVVKWYLDGKSYFYAISEALMTANEEILIESWWLSPELYLRRPPCKNEEYRLDKILKKKAEQGVNIYIVVYHELSKYLPLNSEYSEKVLKGLHPNIRGKKNDMPIFSKASQGRAFLGGNYSMWGYLSLVPRHQAKKLFIFIFNLQVHEKTIVIDRRKSFIGGLDLCFGRYDTSAHQLSDFSHASEYYSIWPGQDYVNSRVKDFTNVNSIVQSWASALLDKKTNARMPFHSTGIGLTGEISHDVARNFILKWNHVKEKYANHGYPMLISQQNDTSAGRNISEQSESGSCSVQILKSSSMWSHGVSESEHSIQNAYIETIMNAKHFIYIENQFFITATEESDDYAAKNLVGKALVERIIKAYKNDEKFRVIVTIPLIPPFAGEFHKADAAILRLVMHYQYQSICRGKRSIIERVKAAGCITPERYIGFYSLRKYDRIDYSAIQKGQGVLKEELTAQSFIDKSGLSTAFEEDSTGAHVTEEILIQSKLLIADDRIVIIGSANLNDRSLNGDHDSEIAAIIEDKNYVESRMAGMRWKAGKFALTLRRAIFKEHLGLMNEADHETANGDCLPPPSTGNGAFVNPQKLTYADRIVEDPVSNKFYYDHWLRTANTNTDVFRNVFHCIPDDSVTNWGEYNDFIPNNSKIPFGHICEQARQNHTKTRKELSKIRGHLVVFPLEFMNGEKLAGSMLITQIARENSPASGITDIKKLVA
ncbi:11758_t:CDS:10 [Acaulospora morrowiae]|uniref:phospholipase D n=1 Tax=Acaulospora morrowiae TaxID=94023 RepID=A0A9N8VTP9_9GLOM|nr:11758_t:CDS:10 [Acaulospora morrowiae]